MRRIWTATKNSYSALRHLLRHEPAVQQELALLILGIPVGWTIAEDAGHLAFLLGCLVVLILVEVLNTAIEASCNAITREFNENIKLAKDCGSLAVALAILLCAAVWAFAFYDYFFGVPV